MGKKKLKFGVGVELFCVIFPYSLYKILWKISLFGNTAAISQIIESFYSCISELIGDEKGVVDLVSDDENENNQIPPPSKKPKVSSTLPLPMPKPPKFQNFGNSSGKNKLLSTTSKVCILKKSTQQPPKETPVVEDIDVDEAEPLVHIDSGKGPDEEPLDEGMIWHSVEIRYLHILNVL